MADDDLSTWTIYNHPADHPEDFVARRYSIQGGEPVAGRVMLVGPLESLRAYFAEEGMFCIVRDPSDDPVIVETWL